MHFSECIPSLNWCIYKVLAFYPLSFNSIFQSPLFCLYLCIWDFHYIPAINQIFTLHSSNITFTLKIMDFLFTAHSFLLYFHLQFCHWKSYIFFHGKLICGLLEEAFHFLATGFLKFAGIHNLSQMSLCCEGCLVHDRTLPGIPSSFPLYVIISPRCEN